MGLSENGVPLNWPLINQQGPMGCYGYPIRAQWDEMGSRNIWMS